MLSLVFFRLRGDKLKSQKQSVFDRNKSAEASTRLGLRAIHSKLVDPAFRQP
jgi:hypothetical protein